MKACINKENFNTCGFRYLTKSEPSMQCCSPSSECTYIPTCVNFADLSDNTLMFHGDIESSAEIHTKKEWQSIFGKNNFCFDVCETWYTAKVSHVVLDLENIFSHIAEDKEVYENWYEDATGNPVIVQAFKIINQELKCYPTYWEDKKVIF